MPKHRLTQIFLLMLFGVSLISIVLIGFMWISYEKNRSVQEIERVSQDFFRAQEESISRETNRICDYIEAQTLAGEMRFLKSMKSKVNSVWTLLDTLNNQHHSYFSGESGKSMALTFLGNFSRVDFEKYLVVTLDGEVLLNPEGDTVPSHSQSLADSSSLKEILASVKVLGEGFYNLDLDNGPKISYLKVYEPLGWVVGISEQFRGFEDATREELVRWAESMQLPGNDTLMILTYDGQVLSFEDKSLIGVNIFEDERGANFVQMASRFIRGGKERHWDFLRFSVMDPKTHEKKKSLGYFRAVPSWRWVVVDWVYFRDLEESLKRQQEILAQNVKKQISRVVMISMTMLVIIIILYRLIAARANHSFAAFFNFFENAATSSKEIDSANQPFQEFARLAEAANRMISQRKIIEKKLVDSETMFRTVFEVSPQLVFLVDMEGRILEVNEEFGNYIKCSLSEAIGQKIFSLFEVEQSIYAHIKNELSLNGVVRGFELSTSNRKGDLVTLLFFGKRLTLENDDFVLGLMTDISELKKSEKEKILLQDKLARSQKMEGMGLMAAEVAHNLNNILSGIIGYPQLLMRESNITEEQKGILADIVEAGQRSASVVNDILVVAKGVAVSKTGIDFNDIVKEVLISSEYNAIMANLKTQVLVSENLLAGGAFIFGSRVHLVKSVLNVVLNSLEAFPDGHIGAKVEISVQKSPLKEPLPGFENMGCGDYIIVTVKDNGPGIPQEDQSKIFEPFFTHKNASFSGTGLGLTVVNNTVRDHGGGLVLESSSSGTCLSLYFPAIKKPKLLTKELEAFKGRGQKILVVDDVDIQRKLAEKMLKTLGYETFSVASGELAVDYLKENDVDLLVLDMIMDPGMNGRATFEAVRAFKSEQKAIIASGMAENEEVKKALALGARQFISKPYTLDDIAKVVFNALNS